MSIDNTLSLLSSKEALPYHLLSDIVREFDGEEEVDSIKRGAFVSEILSSPNAKDIFMSLRDLGVLDLFVKDMSEMMGIAQKKSVSKNLFQHTLNVIEKVPFDNIVLRWAALLHDFGKIDTYNKNKSFKGHEQKSYTRCVHLLNKFRVPEVYKISNVVLNHMAPLNYDRNPNWTTETLKKKIHDWGNEESLSVIEFSIYDKLAERPEQDVVRLRQLHERTKDILYGKASN